MGVPARSYKNALRRREDIEAAKRIALSRRGQSFPVQLRRAVARIKRLENDLAALDVRVTTLEGGG